MSRYTYIANAISSAAFLARNCDDMVQGTAVWQHNEPGLEPPPMAGGLMGGLGHWTIFK